MCKLKPHKFEKHRSRLTVSGKRVDYPFPISTPTADITTFKCLINVVLSTPPAKFMTVDIHNFYFNMLIEHFKYMKLLIDISLEEFITQYNFCLLDHNNGHVYVEIHKGM